MLHVSSVFCAIQRFRKPEHQRVVNTIFENATENLSHSPEFERILTQFLKGTDMLHMLFTHCFTLYYC